jgi:NitT/TauT family transport system permease protein
VSQAVSRPLWRRALRRTVMFVASLLVVAVGWELYKLVGPANGGSLGQWRILPRANDRAMPHVWDMVSRLTEPERRGSDTTVAQVVLSGAWYSLRLALVGFALGAFVGFALAVVMARFRLVEYGLLPYLVVSQTVPLIALAPLVVAWGGRVSIGDWVWPRWLSASIIGAFLAFFPVAVAALRGFSSASRASLELMDSYAASWWQTFRRLRLPSAVPALVPGLRLGASAAVVGVVVAEISTGLRGGVGRLIIEYGRQTTSDPAKVYTAVFGAAALGLALAGLVAVIDLILMRNRPLAGAS